MSIFIMILVWKNYLLSFSVWSYIQFYNFVAMKNP